MVLFTLFVLPLVSTVRFSGIVFMSLALSAFLITALLIVFGLGEWRNCERDYTIRLLKIAGEQARIAQN